MDRNNKTKIFIVFLISMAFPVAIFVVYNSISLRSRELLNKSNEIAYISVNNGILKSNLYLTSKLSCTPVNKELQLVSRSGEKFLLGDILSDSVTHILFIPPMFCSSCNEKVLQMLPDIVESFDSKLKIICYPSDVNTVINYCKKKISYRNLLITKERIIEEHEKINKIYILSLTNLGLIKSIFLINDSDIKSFEEYLEFCVK